MYPKCTFSREDDRDSLDILILKITFPDSNRKAPNNKQKNIGPAKSASSKMCSLITCQPSWYSSQKYSFKANLSRHNYSLCLIPDMIKSYSKFFEQWWFIRKIVLFEAISHHIARLCVQWSATLIWCVSMTFGWRFRARWRCVPRIFGGRQSIMIRRRSIRKRAGYFWWTFRVH